MFCSKCGKESSNGFKFCKSCGYRFVHEQEDKDSSPGKMLDNVLTTLFLVVMFGLGILVGLVAVLLANNVPVQVVTVIVVAYLAAVFGICVSLVRQVTKLIDARLKGLNQQQEFEALPDYAQRNTAQLEEFREPTASVTERTTRTLVENR